MNAETAWQAGRFDARRGPKRILFGRMYEDTEIERTAFGSGGRVFCIASAGCTALSLADDHDVVACDINPTQLAYAQRRIAGSGAEIGAAERVMGFGRALMFLAGWSDRSLKEFLALTEPDSQLAFWREHLDTWRFRAGLGTLTSITALRAVYASQLLDCLPESFGSVLRRRMERVFAHHPNATNPYARALLLGDPPPAVVSPARRTISLVLGDAASVLEASPPASLDGFTLSNILDGASPTYAQRLRSALAHAGKPDAPVVLRSFREPDELSTSNRAVNDRSMLWGIVDVRRVSEL